MSRVFELTTIEGVEWALPAEERLQFLELADQGAARRWQPVDMYLLRKDPRTGRPTAASDIPWYSGSTPVLKEPAVRALEPFLGSAAEVLPLRCADCPLWLLNVTARLDALDEEASEIDRIPGSNRFLKIRRHMFKPAALSGVHMFKLAQMPRGSVYFTDEAAAALGGLERVAIRQVWEG